MSNRVYRNLDEIFAGEYEGMTYDEIEKVHSPPDPLCLLHPLCLLRPLCLLHPPFPHPPPRHNTVWHSGSLSL